MPPCLSRLAPRSCFRAHRRLPRRRGIASAATQRYVRALPPEAEILQLGDGAQARWSVVRDPSAEQQVASSDPAATCQTTSTRWRSTGRSRSDVAARVQFKIVSGRMKDAGLVLRYQDANN